MAAITERIAGLTHRKPDIPPVLYLGQPPSALQGAEAERTSRDWIEKAFGRLNNRKPKDSIVMAITAYLESLRSIDSVSAVAIRASRDDGMRPYLSLVVFSDLSTRDARSTNFDEILRRNAELADRVSGEYGVGSRTRATTPGEVDKALSNYLTPEKKTKKSIVLRAALDYLAPFQKSEKKDIILGAVRF